MNFSKTWLLRSAETVAAMAVLAFLGTLLAGGANFSLSTAHAAVIASYIAALTAAQSALAGLINPASAPPTALATRAFAQLTGIGQPVTTAATTGPAKPAAKRVRKAPAREPATK